MDLILEPALHSPADDHILPDYAQTVLPVLDDTELPVLTFVSHGHSPPLNPRPDLKFDVRNLPNPPKHIRDAYNGTSKRLQEWMKENPAFLSKRDAIRSQILVAMTARMGENEKEDVVKTRLADNQNEIDCLSSAPSNPSGETAGDQAGRRGFDEVEFTDSGSSVGEGLGIADHGNSLTVSIFCAMGRHRSVAMVEELARMPWPGCQVDVKHRDLVRKRGQGQKSAKRDRKSRGTRGGVFINDCDE